MKAQNILFATIAVFSFATFVERAYAYEAPAIEAFFGASNIVATTGNGRLTAAVSPEGDISVLSWPSPSYYDHLQYIASNAPDARDLPRAGALDGMGIFSALVTESSSGERAVSWFNNGQEWEWTVRYADVDSVVTVTEFEHRTLPIRVLQHDFVAVDADVLHREYTVETDPAADVENVWILGYANLSPSQTKLEQMPIADFALEQHQDFAAVWDATNESIVHFHPADNGTLQSPLHVVAKRDNMAKEFGPLGELLKGETIDPTEVQALVGNLDGQFEPGAYIAQGSTPAPDEFQVGYDRTPVCEQIDRLADRLVTLLDDGTNPGFTIPSSVVGILRCGIFKPLQTPREDNGWLHDAADALIDSADGTLDGNPIAAAQVNTALRVPVIRTNGVGHASLYFAFGETAAGANASLASARDADRGAARAAVDAEWAAWAADLVMPTNISERYRAFLVRAFLNLRVGTDAESGAIVASISRQPSYHVDWPRDGVFFDVALDLAGKHDLVRKRLGFYADTMRTEPVSPTMVINTGPPGWPDDPDRDEFPAGSWEMNYYADGVPSGNIRLEIDNTALVVWSYADHAGWIEDDAERRAYLEEFWPTVETAANWLAGWRDPETGLIWPSNEDDHIEYTQGMQGNGTTFLALEAAAMIAKTLGHEEQTERWAARARELHAAILEHLWDPDARRFISQPPWSERTVAHPTEWIGWPIRVVPWEDPSLRAQIAEGVERHVASVRGERPRGQYPTKAAISAALVLEGEPEVELASEIAETLATEIAHPETHMIGESFVNDDTDGDGVLDRRLNVQGNPHLWSAILVYITARAVESPGDFDRYREVLEPVDVRTSFPGTEDTTPDMGESADMGVPDLGDSSRTDGEGRSLASSSISGSGCGCEQAPRRGVPGSLVVFFVVLGFVRTRDK